VKVISGAIAAVIGIILLYAIFHGLQERRNAIATRVDQNEANFWRDSDEFRARLYQGIADHHKVECGMYMDKELKEKCEREQREYEEIANRYKKQSLQEDERAQQLRQNAETMQKEKEDKARRIEKSISTLK
jgi:hypothetical protein